MWFFQGENHFYLSKRTFFSKCLNTNVWLWGSVVANNLNKVCCYATLILHMQKYHSVDGRSVLLNRKRNEKKAGGWPLIFERFHWILAPVLHTKGKNCSEDLACGTCGLHTGPASHPPHLSNPALLYSPHNHALHPNTSCFIHRP